MLSGNPVSSEILLGPCCPEFNSGGRTRTGFGVRVRREVRLAQVRTFAKLLVTHGFRLKGPLFAGSEYGLGRGRGTDLSTGKLEGRGRKGTKVGRTEGGEWDRRSGLSVGLGLDR